MADLRLGKLPDRVPVKLTISVSPELNRALSDYARAYEQAYGGVTCRARPGHARELPGQRPGIRSNAKGRMQMILDARFLPGSRRGTEKAAYRQI